MSKSRCADVIAGSKCPLAYSGCRTSGNRIKVIQHVAYGNTIDTDWIASVKQTDNRPSLLELPREIRDAIYDAILPTGQHYELGHVALDYMTQTSHIHPWTVNYRLPDFKSLVCVSKQLHHEVAARFYTANTFSVTLKTDGSLHIEDMLRTFDFAGLIPMHPAYVRFLPRIELTTSFDPTREPEQLQVTIPRPAPTDTAIAPSPEATEARITAFLRIADSAIKNTTSCACLHLIPLGRGTYTLRRPPGPKRTACHRATWSGVKRAHGPEIERLQNGEYRGHGRRPTRCGPVLPAWLCGLVLCASCLTCCLLPWCFSEGCRARRKRWGKGLKRVVDWRGKEG